MPGVTQAVPAPRALEDLRDRDARRAFFDSIAPDRDRWKSRNAYYHAALARLLRTLIPPGQKVLEVGCGTGDLLAGLEPGRGVGVDFSPRMLELARERHPGLEFVQADAEDLPLRETFDAVVLSGVVGSLSDILRSFQELKKVSGPDTRVVVTYYNYLWQPVLLLGETLGLKMPRPRQNWVPMKDLVNLLDLAGYDVVKSGCQVLVPFYVPVVSWLVNRFIAPLPVINHLCLQMYLVARPRPPAREYTVSVVIPTRNEAANVDPLVDRTPELGLGTEILFVDGGSSDGTPERVREAIERTRGKRDVKLLIQPDPKGKADAVHIGFRAAKGDILMILDADVTVQPEDLVKFYALLAEGKAEFVNGCRLVYPMDDQAMRPLNLVGNKFFSVALSWLLDQRVRDTLCGTKVFFRRHYARIMSVRDEIGDADPFGDFELLFGASRANLRIVELPVRYRERSYGVTKISRFKHGFQLLRLCGVVLRRLRLPKA